MFKIGVLVSGSGTNLQALIDNAGRGLLQAKIVFVGTDKPSCDGVTRAKTHGIPVIYADYKVLGNREKAEDELLRQMAAYDFDLLVLAGYMRILSPKFIDTINGCGDNPRIVNIHPALLPAFPGTNGYGDTFSHGCKVAGCTVHFVDYGEDTGAIIGQRPFAITPQDTLATVKEEGIAVEWALYTDCINLIAAGKVKVVKNDSGRYVTVIES